MVAHILQGREDDMVKVQLPFAATLRGIDTQFVHAFLGFALHVAAESEPSPSPAGEVDAIREPTAYLALLAELEADGVGEGLF